MIIDRTYLTSELERNRLRERGLRFLRAHQDAFDVEPNPILSLFEETVLGIESGAGLLSFCTVEKEHLFATHFAASGIGYRWPNSLNYAVKFLDRVETGLGVKLNRDLLYQFSALHSDSNKIKNNALEIDLKPRQEDSCIKVLIAIKLEEESEELVSTALALDGGSYSPELIQVLLKSTLFIRFNFFLNGYSDIELSPACFELDNKQKPNRSRYFKDYIRKSFSPKINYLLEESQFLLAAFSKEKKAEPLLSFIYRDIKRLREYLFFNSLGDRICSFFESQDCVDHIGVTATEAELEKDRLDNFTLYNQKWSNECII